MARFDLVPAVTAAQMREVDRIAVEDFGISILQMMENAGRALAQLTRIQLSSLSRRRVVVLAGGAETAVAEWPLPGGLPSGAPRCGCPYCTVPTCSSTPCSATARTAHRATWKPDLFGPRTLAGSQSSRSTCRRAWILIAW
jgi:hypothetical protein